jgi:UDP-glucose 4-epimerase
MGGSMGKILVTGGAGFIGSNISERLHDDYDVTIFDNFSTGNRGNLAGLNIQLVEGDILVEESLQKACHGVDVIFHLAAQISVPLSMEDPIGTVQANTIGTLNVLTAAVKQGVEHIVLSSSAAIYGDNPSMPKKESMVPEPKSPYAVTKLDGEYYFKMFREEYGIDAVCLRYFNVFGPRQDPSSAYAAVIPAFIHRATNSRDLTIYGDGEQTRDFVYVEDVVAANLLAAGMEAPPKSTGKSSTHHEHVYNVACGRSVSVNELARMIIEISGSRSKVVHEAERPGDVKHSLADISKIKTELGFKPKTDLSGGLERTVRFFT